MASSPYTPTLFASKLEDGVQIFNFAVRYPSYSFASFVDLFIAPEDSVNLAVLKLHLIKSLIVSYLITYSLISIRRFPLARPLFKELIICIFAVPYTFFMASSVYPASIATVALIPILLTVKVWQEYPHISRRQIAIMAINMVVALSVVFSNRFETSAFLGVAIAMSLITKWKIPSTRSRKVLLVILYTSLLSYFLIRNMALRQWFWGIVLGEAKVLNPKTANSSAVVEKIGEVGLSVTAPFTTIDNSTRNISGALDMPERLVPPIVKIPFLIMCWLPLVWVLAYKFRPLVASLTSWPLNLRKVLVNNFPQVTVIFLFLAIPLFARTIWFYQYLAPLLAVLIFLVPARSERQSVNKLLLYTGLVSNGLIFVWFNAWNRPVILGNLAIEQWALVPIIAALGPMAGLSAKLILEHEIQ